MMAPVASIKIEAIRHSLGLGQPFRIVSAPRIAVLRYQVIMVAEDVKHCRDNCTNIFQPKHHIINHGKLRDQSNQKIHRVITDSHSKLDTLVTDRLHGSNQSVVPLARAVIGFPTDNVASNGDLNVALEKRRSAWECPGIALFHRPEFIGAMGYLVLLVAAKPSTKVNLIFANLPADP